MINYIQLPDEYPEALKQLARTQDDAETEGGNTVELISDLEDVLDINQEVRFGTVMNPEEHDFH